MKETGSCLPITKNWGRKAKIQDLNKFKSFVEEKPDRTQGEMAEEWGGVSKTTIGRGLKRIDFTYKKKRLATKRETK